jgi:hypothetical protein
MEPIRIGKQTFKFPFADRLPPLTEEEDKWLREDIRSRGVLVAVVIDEEGNVLDGHNRVRTAWELELKSIPVDIRRGLTWKQKEELADDLNLHRRHLSREQKQQLIARKLKANPQKSNRQIAGEVGADDKTVGAVRSKLEERSEIPNVEKRETKDNRQYPSSKATSSIAEFPQCSDDEEDEDEQEEEKSAPPSKAEAKERTASKPRPDRLWTDLLQSVRERIISANNGQLLEKVAPDWSPEVRQSQINTLESMCATFRQWIDTLRKQGENK